MVDLKQPPHRGMTRIERERRFRDRLRSAAEDRERYERTRELAAREWK
jgi:GrpB-like predicted nucleotidyltransferase (UPF0157 family)